MQGKEQSPEPNDKWRTKLSEWQRIMRQRKIIEGKLALHQMKNKVVTVFESRKK